MTTTFPERLELLQPIEQGLPVLYFPKYHEYWSQYETGSLRIFELCCGGFGFYQLNLEPLEQQRRRFYEEHPAPPP